MTVVLDTSALLALTVDGPMRTVTLDALGADPVWLWLPKDVGDKKVKELENEIRKEYNTTYGYEESDEKGGEDTKLDDVVAEMLVRDAVNFPRANRRVNGIYGAGTDRD